MGAAAFDRAIMPGDADAPPSLRDPILPFHIAVVRAQYPKGPPVGLDTRPHVGAVGAMAEVSSLPRALASRHPGTPHQTKLRSVNFGANKCAKWFRRCEKCPSADPTSRLFRLGLDIAKVNRAREILLPDDQRRWSDQHIYRWLLPADALDVDVS